MANLFKNYKDSKKWRFGDFLQNLAFNIYPCFLPESMFIDDEDTNSLAFIEAIIFAWPYSI